MMNSIIEATTASNGSFATPGGSERVLLLFARYSGRADIQTLAQEEEALEAEDILTQAEEANALYPVG
jgi:hypothetical protein